MVSNNHWKNYYLRSTRTADKRVLLFTNEDDPFGSIKGITKTDMMRTTLQRAKVLIHISLLFSAMQNSLL